MWSSAQLTSVGQFIPLACFQLMLRMRVQNKSNNLSKFFNQIMVVHEALEQLYTFMHWALTNDRTSIL